MSKLKAIIFSARNVLFDFEKGCVDHQISEELVKLLIFCGKKGIQCYVHSNDIWLLNSNGSKVNIAQYLGDKAGVTIKYFNPTVFSSIPKKPQAAAVGFILQHEGLVENEVLYIGGTDNDMRTAVNGGLLFLSAGWYSGSLDYGFKFNSVKDVARFVDTCCLREHFWFQDISCIGFSYKSLSPFSTYKSEFKDYSESARLVAKFNTGLIEFWLQLLISSIYFSGLYKEIDYICSYPGHRSGYGNEVMDKYLDIFAKCFRKMYLPDLVVRHTDCMKSQIARQQKQPLKHESQINTICLNDVPKKGLYGSPYLGFLNKVKDGVKKNRPYTVLLIDDICTSGCSLEAGRVYLQSAGMNVLCLSWLKTISVSYDKINTLQKNILPYSRNFFTNGEIGIHSIPYASMITDKSAPKELSESLQDFENWTWGF